MNIQEILQIMSDNAKPDKNGDICKNGHVMHNIHFKGAPILVVEEYILGAVLHHPNRFTLAPRTHKVNGFDVPMPMDVRPKQGSDIWLSSPCSYEWTDRVNWNEHPVFYRYLKRGLVHLTKEAAIAHGRAICGIDPEAENEE
tara:strand:- start:1024 stop:1449 length:426 start_codon:yes stop_codon:yes gene_type:complete